MDEPETTTTDGEAPTPLATPADADDTPEDAAVAVTVVADPQDGAVQTGDDAAPTISVSEIPIPSENDDGVAQESSHEVILTDNASSEEVAAIAMSPVPAMPPVPNPQDLLVEAAAQHAAAAANAETAAAAAASSILAPSEISAQVTAAAAAAAASLNGFSGGDSDLMLSNEIAQTVLDAATPANPNEETKSANFSHEKHLATRRLKDRERYANMTPDQREVYNAKRREQYHRQSEASRKKRRERERARYHSLSPAASKERNARRAALERERYKKLDPAELAARNARRRERAAALRAQKKAAAAAAAGKMEVLNDVTISTGVNAPMVAPPAGQPQAPPEGAQDAMMEEVVLQGSDVIKQDDTTTHIPLAPLPNLPVAVTTTPKEEGNGTAENKSSIAEV